jgi:hypothetical protein
MWKSKFFWINLIPIVINVIQYVITNNLLPDYTLLFTTIIGLLQVILNAIVGIKAERTVIGLKKQIASLKSK